MKEHGIITNKIIVSYNYERIDKDFDIYMITKKSKKLDRINVLDLPIEKWKALSVQYTFGRDAFVLFTKGAVDEYEFRNSFQETYEDVTVQKVDIFDEEFRKMHFYHNDRRLAQLLINSLKTPRGAKYSYNNLTGKMFYFDSSWRRKDKIQNKVYMFYGLDIIIHPGMYISLDVKTFKLSDNIKEPRQYVFDKKTSHLRRKTKTDNAQEDSYIIGGLRNTKNTVDFIDIESIQKFSKTKMGILRGFLSDVREKLGEYFDITFSFTEDSNNYIIKTGTKMETSLHISDYITRPVNLIDDVKNSISKSMIENISSELETFFGIHATIGDWERNSYNIRLIHDISYYEENKENDVHNDVPSGMIVQHITVEQGLFTSVMEKPTPALTKILQELLIKSDIQKGSIQIYNWKAQGFERTWTFVVRKKISDSYNKVPHYNRAGSPAYYNYIYSLVKIDAKGSLSFDSFCDSDNLLSEEYEKIIKFYEETDKSEFGSGNEIEGMVYSSIENIHVILRTKMFTMPNIDAIYNGLDETNPKSIVDVPHLIDMLKTFTEEYPDQSEHIESIINQLNCVGNEISKRELKRIINYRKNPKKTKLLNRYLNNTFGFRLYPETKSIDYEEEYLIGNILDIKYYHQKEYSGKNVFMYFVGTKREQLQSSVHNACILRKVISEIDITEFEKLLPLMAVEFVRNNQYTVLPFPFKYLREYEQLNDKVWICL